jgi:hypothetical protein
MTSARKKLVLLEHYKIFQKVCEPTPGLNILAKETTRIAGPLLSGSYTVEVGVLLAADSQSTSSSGFRASLWVP